MRNSPAPCTGSTHSSGSLRNGADVEREHACDDLVLAQGGRASDYARHLLQVVADADARLAPGAAAMAAKRSNIRGRIEAILSEGIDRRPTSRRASLCLMALCLCLALPVMLVGAKAQEKKAPDTAPTRKEAPKIDPAKLSAPPEATYSLDLKIDGETVKTKWVINDRKALCVESEKAPGKRSIRGAQGSFRKVAPGSFQIVAHGQGYTANQTWAFQPDGSAKVLEVPDRGENQRAVPVADYILKEDDDPAAIAKNNLPKLKMPPAGTYALELLIDGKKVKTKWEIKNSTALCIESEKAPGDRVIKGATGRFQLARSGSFFHTSIRGKGYVASQMWEFQTDGSAKVLEIPNRGENQRAVPIDVKKD